jgi:very-short-patch-repair endonuclease
MSEPTYYAKILIEELEERGLRVIPEYHDGHKSVDIFIPKANLEIEIDGRQHYEETFQAYSDLLRQGFSMKAGRRTIRISNKIVYERPKDVADIISQLVKDLKKEEIKEKPEEETVSEVLEKSFIEKYKEKFKRFDIAEAKRKTKKAFVFSYRYLKKSIILSIELIIALFIFPILYYVFSYVLYAMSILFFIIFSETVAFLFSKNQDILFSWMAYSFVGKTFVFLKDLSPFIWKLIYGTSTKPLIVMGIIITSFIIGYFKTR